MVIAFVFATYYIEQSIFFLNSKSYSQFCVGTSRNTRIHVFFVTGLILLRLTRLCVILEEATSLSLIDLTYKNAIGCIASILYPILLKKFIMNCLDIICLSCPGISLIND